MSFWTDLVDAAVLGTGRAAPPPPPPSVADLAKDDPGLLRLAAVASRARRACYSPAASGLEAPGQAPPDHRPGVSVAATQRLAELLADEQEELVAEWLRLLAGVDRRPPEARLPDLLWGAAQSERIRAALTPVLGPVATWLAAQNPAWDWAVTAGQAGQASQASQAAQPDLDRWTTAAAGRSSARPSRRCRGQSLVTRPADTIMVLVSDLIEGGDQSALLRRLAALIDSGVRLVVLLALSDDGAPSYDHQLAAACASMGAPAFACTPDLFPELLASVIRRADLTGFVSRHGLVAAG